MIEWTTASTLMRSGVIAYSNRHLIQEYWTKAKVKIDFGKTQILVTGLPNTGKTVLVHQIQGKAREINGGFKHEVQR
jgi:GTPase SAR1 family protein